MRRNLGTQHRVIYLQPTGVAERPASIEVLVHKSCAIPCPKTALVPLENRTAQSRRNDLDHYHYRRNADVDIRSIHIGAVSAPTERMPWSTPTRASMPRHCTRSCGTCSFASFSNPHVQGRRCSYVHMNKTPSIFAQLMRIVMSCGFLLIAVLICVHTSVPARSLMYLGHRTNSIDRWFPRSMPAGNVPQSESSLATLYHTSEFSPYSQVTTRRLHQLNYRTMVGCDVDWGGTAFIQIPWPFALVFCVPEDDVEMDIDNEATTVTQSPPPFGPVIGTRSQTTVTIEAVYANTQN